MPSKVIELITIENNRAIPHPMAYTIDVFKEIIRRDRGSKGDPQGRKKEFAAKELAYIWYMYHPTSPYARGYEESMRQTKVIDDVFGKNSDWVPDDTILLAAEVFRRPFDESMGMQLLTSAESSMFKLKAFFDSVDLNAEDKSGKPKYKPSDILSAVTGLGKGIAEIRQLKNEVLSEFEQNEKIYGGVTKTKYNE